MVDLLSARERDAVISPLLREYVAPLGLHEIAPRRWIDGSRPPARWLFELQLLKGAALKACWGFSLDFVPHVSRDAARWHRSDKTAMLDVFVDPKALPQPSYLFGACRLRADLVTLLRGSTYEGMLAIIRDIRDQHTNCFGFRYYTQLPLASAFLLAKIGQLEMAERELEEYLDGDWLKKPATQKLWQLLHESPRTA